MFDISGEKNKTKGERADCAGSLFMINLYGRIRSTDWDKSFLGEERRILFMYMKVRHNYED